ncbi:kinase-like protein [Calocera cornea HHB12733]|uniref:Kinase-like protein n=1 Tax=Calocera cornea HHB12733 TaxID=1353952 RepID=A0A165E1C1_9BASI|nr:kinase-like protein [Calocera cornea HHB12733]
MKSSIESRIAQLRDRLTTASLSIKSIPAFDPSQDYIPGNITERVSQDTSGRSTISQDFETWQGYYRPRHSTRRIKIALKFSPLYDTLCRLRSQESLDREIVRWIRLKHPNILPFLGTAYISIETVPSICFVVPWMENGNVMTWIKTHRDVEKLALLQGVAQGLLYLHSQQPPIIHGELRGSNVLIDSSGQPRLCDFGIEQFRDRTGHSEPVVTGPERYSSWAPERLNPTRFGLETDEAAITPSSDVYSFGMTAYEILAEKRPFSEQRTFDLIVAITNGQRPELPSSPEETIVTKHLDLLVSKCWSQDAAKRPTTPEVVKTISLLSSEGAPAANSAEPKSGQSR